MAERGQSPNIEENSIPQDKKHLREALLAARRSVPAAERESRDARILGHLAQMAGPEPVFIYIGQDFEIATLPFITARLERGFPVCVPRTKGRGRMEACLLESLSGLRPGRLGLLEPDEGCRTLPCAALGLIVVPGLAFDRAGYRLGRGGGYYDRYLGDCRVLYENAMHHTSAAREIPSVGLCYEEFLQNFLPREPHDRPVGRLITQEGVRPCN